jgi:3-mercaptopyruvate sulfurtransferase SseA
MLQARGVKDVRALLGGWNQWVADGDRVAKGK